MIDCLLIQPNSRSSAYGSLADLAAVEPPVWAGLLATFLLQKGYGVEILDAHALDLSAGQIGQAVADAKPRLAVAVAYGHQPSASTQTMPAARAALQAIRQHAPWVSTAILGGHPSALPERTLREEPVDFVVEGEGPYTLAALIEAIKHSTSVEKVPGLWWKDADGSAYRNAPAPLVRHLDQELPGVAWDLLPMDKYRAHGWHVMGWSGGIQPYAALYTSLGCPYACAFCMIQAPMKAGEAALGFNPEVNTYRMWSPETIGAQLRFLAERYGVRNIKMADEMHILNRQHVEGISDQILDAGLEGWFNIWAYSRIDTVKWPDLLEKMKRAGYRWLALGIEAAKSTVRDGQDKGFSDAQIVKTVRQIQEAGIFVVGNYIFGLEGETMDSMQETLDLALELRCEWANFYPVLCLPGSRLYSGALKAGRRLSDNWAAYGPLSYDCEPFAPDGLLASDILRFRDAAFVRYFSDPAYLAMVSAKFGDDSVVSLSAIVSAGSPTRRICGD